MSLRNLFTNCSGTLYLLLLTSTTLAMRLEDFKTIFDTCSLYPITNFLFPLNECFHPLLQELSNYNSFEGIKLVKFISKLYNYSML